MATVGKAKQQKFYVNIYTRRLYFDMKFLNLYQA
jgi:hypothetical protein